MKNKILNILVTVLTLITLGSCTKDKGIAGKGLNLVRFPFNSPSDLNNNPVVLLTGTQAGQIQINRDTFDPSILDKSETVTLSVDNTIIDKYNAANGTSFFAIDPTAYSFDAPSTLTAGKIIVNFAAGEYIKIINFTLDLSKVPAGSSAFGLKIEKATVCTVSPGSNGTLIGIIKNPFAGTYNVTGTRYNYAGSVSWDTASNIPAGYVGTTNMANYSPRAATPVDGLNFTMPIGNISPAYMYNITYDPAKINITEKLSFPVSFTNFQYKVVSLTAPATGVKAKFHLITHYTNSGGNDRIFDESFVQQ